MGFFDDLSKKVAESSAKRKERNEEKKQQRLAEDEEYNNILAQFQNNKATKIENYYFDLVDHRILQARKTFSRNYKVIDFKDIIDYKVSQSTHDEVKTQSKGKEKKKHGLTRALVGGVIAGPAGAIVGGVTAKKKNNGKSVSVTNEITDHLGIIFYLKDGTSFEIVFLNSSVKNNGFIAKTAYSDLNNTLAMLKTELQSNQVEENNINNDKPDSISSLDEIKKLKELLDIGAITQEEFDLKKKQILNL